MIDLIGWLVLCIFVAGLIEWFTESESMDYQRVPGDPYPDQITVTLYPGLIWRLFGAESDKTVFVSRDGAYHFGWYEIPDLNEVSVIGSRTDKFIRLIRQVKYVEGSRA
jgi:hypothetical protein